MPATNRAPLVPRPTPGRPVARVTIDNGSNTEDADWHFATPVTSNQQPNKNRRNMMWLKIVGLAMLIAFIVVAGLRLDDKIGSISWNWEKILIGAAIIVALLVVTALIVRELRKPAAEGEKKKTSWGGILALVAVLIIGGVTWNLVTSRSKPKLPEGETLRNTAVATSASPLVVEVPVGYKIDWWAVPRTDIDKFTSRETFRGPTLLQHFEVKGGVDKVVILYHVFKIPQ